MARVRADGRRIAVIDGTTEGFPNVPARMIVVDGWRLYWRVSDCPLCGGRHLHGVGVDPRLTGGKFPHCVGLRDEQTQYVLVDEDPVRTRRILEETARW
jgi:hypothetical protein